MEVDVKQKEEICRKQKEKITSFLAFICLI